MAKIAYLNCTLGTLKKLTFIGQLHMFYHKMRAWRHNFLALLKYDFCYNQRINRDKNLYLASLWLGPMENIPFFIKEVIVFQK